MSTDCFVLPMRGTGLAPLGGTGGYCTYIEGFFLCDHTVGGEGTFTFISFDDSAGSDYMSTVSFVLPMRGTGSVVSLDDINGGGLCIVCFLLPLLGTGRHYFFSGGFCPCGGMGTLICISEDSTRTSSTTTGAFRRNGVIHRPAPFGGVLTLQQQQQRQQQLLQHIAIIGIVGYKHAQGDIGAGCASGRL